MLKKQLALSLKLMLLGSWMLAVCACGRAGAACVDGAATRTKGCDEFTRLSNTVTQYRSGKTYRCSGPWCQLKNKDELAVNNTGQAELHFTACGEGRLYLFRSSSTVIQVSSCSKADFGDPSVVCVKNGALFADQCAGEFDPVTGSAKIKKTGSSFLITYQPENEEVTVVIVAEGSAQVAPVVSYEPTRLGEPIEVGGGEFIFTMPDELLHEIGGLRPRDKYPVELLPPLVQELGIQDWVVDAAGMAREKQYLPPNWPLELGGDFVPGEPLEQPPGDLVVVADGGELADPRIQMAIYQAIDWMALRESSLPARVRIDGEDADPIESALFDPEKSMEVLRSSFPNGLILLLTFPEEDAQLEGGARVIADYLAKVGVRAELSPTPGPELLPRVQTMIAAGEPVIYLIR